jgi:hypothetical protein
MGLVRNLVAESNLRHHDAASCACRICVAGRLINKATLELQEEWNALADAHRR